jgi:anti-sigma regulatory factor (Ser/Thr protein kinase)
MTVRRAFAPTEGSVRAARRFVIATIVDAPSEVRDSVSLMVSELSTNAMVHGGGGYEVIVSRTDHRVLVSVSDSGGGTPVLQSPGSSEPHGRGLRIVDALSDEWGISPTSDDGKSVWFQMALRSGPIGSSDTAAATSTIPQARDDPSPRRRASPWTIPGGTKTTNPIARRRRSGRQTRPRTGTATRKRHRAR